MGDITSNLSRAEGECGCGCGFNGMDFETVMILQQTCNHFSRLLGIYKVTLLIDSWCRCLAWNDHENGSDYSKHLYGIAVDFRIKHVPPQEVQRYLLDKFPRKYGIGVYEEFTHFDSRSDHKRW